MNCQEIPITKLIPHRPPVVLVDKVLHSSQEDTETLFEIRDDNIFLEEGHLTVAGLIENMAQSCACRMGCKCMAANAPVKIGVVGEIKHFTVERLPRLGEVLNTHVCILEEILNLTLAGVTVLIGDQTIATARIKMATM